MKFAEAGILYMGNVGRLRTVISALPVRFAVTSRGLGKI